MVWELFTVPKLHDSIYDRIDLVALDRFMLFVNGKVVTDKFGPNKSVGGVVLSRDGLVLVVNQNGVSWSLPKGHVRKGESETDTARREIYEESGIKNLELICKLGSYQRYKIGKEGDESELKVIVMFLFKTSQKALSPIDPGISEARWVEKKNVEELLTHFKDKEFFRLVAKDLVL